MITVITSLFTFLIITVVYATIGVLIYPFLEKYYAWDDPFGVIVATLWPLFPFVWLCVRIWILLESMQNTVTQRIHKR